MGSPSDGLSARVKRSAERKVGGAAVVGGRGKGGIDCFALVDQVLKAEGARSAADFGAVTPTADYVWGESVVLDKVQPGDILQFRDHSVTIRTQTLGEFRWEDTSQEGPATRPHHTAIVVQVHEDGSVVVVEQNVRPRPKQIARSVIARLGAGEETRRPSNRIKIIITVTGTVKAYRPIPKGKGAMLLPEDTATAVGGRRMLALYVPRQRGPARRPGPVGMG